MSTSGGLTGSPLKPNLGFNWVFLVELIVCGILTLFFLFYLNRLFATLVSYGLRAWTWHKYRVYVDIQSLQISLLGGRVFFKGIKYHGNNETILIHSGFVTWCYWLRNVRDLNVGHDDDVGRKRVSSDSDSDGRRDPNQNVDKAEEGGAKGQGDLPCRLNVSLKGVEWFIYNRSAAYDSVVAAMTKDDKENVETVPNQQGENRDPASKLRKRTRVSDMEEDDEFASKNSREFDRDASPSEKASFMMPEADPKSHESSSTSQTDASGGHGNGNGSPEGAFILRFLPIHIECEQAAVVLGNENTKSVLITKMKRAAGVIDGTKSKTLDQYRQLINFQFEHPVIQMKPNDDYKEDQTAAATRIKLGEADQPQPKEHHVHSHTFLHRQRRKAWHALQDLIPTFRNSVDSISSSDARPETSPPARPGPNSWQGLSRYLDESEQDDKARWSSVEYATVSTILDSPHAYMSFYWDVVGTVPDQTVQVDMKRDKDSSNINGDPPPEWGLDLSLKGAIVNYGPWADRQRADIQRVFFPSLCKDATPAKNLMPGQFRVPTEFKLYIEFDDETILRVPMKEESKNWKWTKQADSMGAQREDQKNRGIRGRKKKANKGNPGPEIRPFGWVDIKIGANATVVYTMDMVAGPSGFSNTLELDLPNTEITTSVNHGLLWKSVDNRLSCDLSNPLGWNSPRTWKFDINSNGLELFILREHIFLFIDLIDDWASGPPPEYLTFTPFDYLINLHLEDFRLYLNVNDSNIVNNPSDFDDNTFIVIYGSVLNAKPCIPLHNYRPHRNGVPFDVDVKHGGLNLHVPPWNTQATFLNSTELATLKELKISGKYQYCATTSTSNTDTLLLDVHGYAPTAQFYGFVIRYFLKIKDNYFGDDIRFKTLEEYQDVLRARREGSDDSSNHPPHKKSNDLDVIIAVTADESSVILPANLYTAKEHVRIDIATLAADLRFTNYYMDLDVVLSTLAFSLGSEQDGSTTPISATSSTQLFIDGVNANGNRLFGLPPTEPTYVCNWDFAVGAVTGECTTDFFGRLSNGGRAFAFSFDDDENALPSISEIILHDITFLRASIESIRLWLHVEDAAFLLSSGTISVNFNDWAGSHYSKKLKLLVPDLKVGCVDAESASRHRSRAQHPVETHALLQTTLSVAMIQRKLGFEKDRQLQQEHVKRHDQRTHRADFLLYPSLLDDSMLEPVDPPAMSVPSMPIPVSSDEAAHQENRSLASRKSSRLLGKRVVSRKSSFLSIRSSGQKSNESIIRPQSSWRTREQLQPDSRSRSVQVNPGSDLRAPLRDISTSTGHRSSFYSAVGDHSRGMPPSSVTFSSSYIAPYFPLEGVEPDSKDLPLISADTENLGSKGTQFSLGDIAHDRVDEDSTHVSFMLELPTGIAVVCNPEAVKAFACLITALQPVDPIDILDEIQIDSMSEIFDLRKQKSITGTVVDFSVRTPSISLRFINSSRNLSYQQAMHDQYDFSMTRLAITSRSETVVKSFTPQGAHKSSTAHLSLASADLSAKERYNDIDDPQAAINGTLEDVACWVKSDGSTSAAVAFKGIQVANASSKIEYLASLLHRTGVLANDIAETFSSVISKQRNRVQLFTYLVATAGQQATDPLFLTRPSYVLRSAPDHLRTTDSWKIITRIHHMYTSLHASTKHDIIMQCLSNTEAPPDNAQQRVLAGFDQWRSWDLNDISSCFVMSRIFGAKDDMTSTSAASSPLKLSFRTELIRLVLDPGPKQNEISLVDITSTFESKTTPFEAEAPSPTDDTPVAQTSIVQFFCGDVSINLNWELCELAEDIMKLYRQSEQRSKPKRADSPSPVKTSRTSLTPGHNLHVVVATEKGSITIDTINIRTTSICEGLNASFVMVDKSGTEVKKSANLMLAAEAATSKIRHHSQELTVSQIRFPSIFGSYESQVIKEIPVNVINVAGNCQQLTFDVKQDILALIEVLDVFIGDEVAQIYRLKKHMPSTTPSQVQASEQPRKPTPINRINVALFLDMYDISIPLLQSLTYNISGVVARASLAARSDSEVVFDFDIKEHSHDMQTVMATQHKSISLLQMPPTNGHITCYMLEKETTVSVFASVEPVELDAAAVHSLLTALNRPEISSVVSEVKEEVKVVQAHLEEIFGPSKKIVKKDVKESKPLIYDAHLTLAGFDIFANAQAHGDSNSARLEFNLGCVQLVLANRVEQNGPVLAFPELRVSLQHIMFELSRPNSLGIMESCGNLAFAAFLTAESKLSNTGDVVRSFHLKSDALKINLFAETASSVVDVMGYLQDKIKDVDLSREKNYLRKLRKSRLHVAINDEQPEAEGSNAGSTARYISMYSLELLSIQVCWLVDTHDKDETSQPEREDLVLSLKRIALSKKKENTARLTIEDLQLQMVPASQDKTQRSLNSALLPEVIFNVGYVSTPDARRFAFQAAGKSLDLRMTSQFIIPAAALQKSIFSATEKVRAATATWMTQTPGPPTESSRRQPFLGKKRMESLLVDADFAGAVVYLSGKKVHETSKATSNSKGGRAPHAGRYGQFSQNDANSNTVLRAPGLAWKVEYKDNGLDEPSLNAEVKVDASSNILFPTVVPLIMEISSTVKEIVSDDDDEKKKKLLQPKATPQKFMSADEDNILTADPSAVLGRTRLNLGLRICRQEFSLSCQPIARVAATARFDDIYMTINTVRSTEHGHFFAISAAFRKLEASVQHVYSRESTGSFEVDSVFLSLMNSKHVSGTSGVSAILKISPMKVLVNAKQLQDFLLFREIWVPPEIRQSSTTPATTSLTAQSQTHLVQRYQQVAATGAFPWNATVSIAELDVQLDLGQAIGKSAFMISKFWISSKKNSDWEQNLCMGFDKVGVDSVGRMSGFVALQDFRIRTSIQWPAREMALNQTPLVQGSVGFSQLRVKAAFDYQAFLVADITSFEFLMYNVRNGPQARGDRLVAILDGEAVQVFCTTSTASQAIALYQAFERLVQEKRANYETSLAEIEKFMQRKSHQNPTSAPVRDSLHPHGEDKPSKSPISLHTDVIVTLKAVNVGAFPNTFSDHQVFKLEALNAQARFAVTMDNGMIHSILGLTLGQLRIGLAGVKTVDVPKSVGELSVEEVISSATGSRGGTILKVPKVEAIMQTWQVPDSNHIDYIFKSFLEGKVEVGWNYSRISYIRGMWASHSKALAQRLGKPLPFSAVKITGVPDDESGRRKDGEQQKITAEVNMPQSKYDYNALEPPIIETPQLRDMGEATPPLEWIGLHRDRLPNLTHQIVIVTLLELASEVEDAYAKILGSS
ncbi:Protein CSF1 [Lachnellula willkommii]|uniref:Protein CSF1 n=1 Tax=Lachnellula willkommii TaxID=215461 RepID=A0A559MEE3_9HELO|nr:Protein CSF1 [Lachnellula willkommii]